MRYETQSLGGTYLLGSIAIQPILPDSLKLSISMLILAVLVAIQILYLMRQLGWATRHLCAECVVYST